MDTLETEYVLDTADTLETEYVLEAVDTLETEYVLETKSVVDGHVGNRVCFRDVTQALTG